jgi:transcription termination/antitermination protein NusG
MTMRWYVVQAYSGFEKTVMRSLKERIRQRELHEHFGKDANGEPMVLVPEEKITEIRDGKKRDTARQFFPGYVLVQMDVDTREAESKRRVLTENGRHVWQLIKETPRVIGFLGEAKERKDSDKKGVTGVFDPPSPLSDKEADAILQRIQEGAEKPKPKILFEVGEVVRVIDGPFNDFNGVVEEINYEKNKLHVAVLIFGRSTPVELDFTQVEKE